MASRAGINRYGDGMPVADIRISQQGDQLVSQLHARWYEAAVRRTVFFSHSAARAISLPATAMVGNIIWNPPDSGVNLSMVAWAGMVHVTSASLVGVVLAAGYQTTNPTGITVANASGSTLLSLSGAANDTFVKGKALAYAIATMLIAPVPVWLLHHNTAAIATTGEDSMQGEFNGALIVPPGGYVCVAAQGAAGAAASYTSSLMWAEVPVL